MLDSATSYTWTSSTLPSGTTLSNTYGYQGNNNLSPGSSMVNTISPSSLSGQQLFLVNFQFDLILPQFYDIFRNSLCKIVQVKLQVHDILINNNYVAMKISLSLYIFAVYGFQNNLVSTTNSVLTSNGMNTHTGTLRQRYTSGDGFVQYRYGHEHWCIPSILIFVLMRTSSAYAYYNLIVLRIWKLLHAQFRTCTVNKDMSVRTHYSAAALTVDDEMCIPNTLLTVSVVHKICTRGSLYWTYFSLNWTLYLKNIRFCSVAYIQL